MFRTLLLGTVAAVALSGAASAADLPIRTAAPAPVYAAPLFTWTGFYVGGQIGYGWGNNSTAEYITATGAFTNFKRTFKPDGILGGLHAGYNMQSGSLVYGLEADIEGSALKGGYTLANGNGTAFKQPWQGSLRGRLGVAYDRALFYVTGGAAFAEQKHTYFTPAIRETSSKTRFGWTLGAGIEYAVSNNWTVRGEYRYTDYGSYKNASLVAFPGFSYKHDPRDHAVRLGLSYKFGGPSAIVAKY